MRFILFVLTGFFSVCSFADIYKCVNNANGKIDYQAKMCAEGYSNVEVDLMSGKETDLDDELEQQLLKEKEQKATLEQLEREKQEVLHKQALLKQAALAETEKNQQLIKDNPDRYSAYAIPPYQSDRLSELVKKYEARLPDIERLRRVASEKALDSNECGRVEAAELSDRSTTTSLVFLIDCSSGAKFYFDEQELSKPQ